MQSCSVALEYRYHSRGGQTHMSQDSLVPKRWPPRGFKQEGTKGLAGLLGDGGIAGETDSRLSFQEQRSKLQHTELGCQASCCLCREGEP